MNRPVRNAENLDKHRHIVAPETDYLLPPIAACAATSPLLRTTTMRILLVDDSATMRRIEKNLLAKLGYTDTIEADNGVSAQVKIEKIHVDLILLDWHMPIMDGLTFLRNLRRQRIRTPVIMVSAEGEKENVLKAVHYGADGYVVKPFAPHVLAEKISVVMKGANEGTSAAIALEASCDLPADDDHLADITAGDIMTTSVVTVTPQTTVFDAIHLLLDESISGMPVVHDNGRIAGMITEKDLLVADQMLAADRVDVSCIMAHDVVSVNEDASLSDVARLLANRGFKRLPVLNNGKLVGVIARRDVLKIIEAARRSRRFARARAPAPWETV